MNVLLGIANKPRVRFVFLVLTLAGAFLLVYREDLLGQMLVPWVDLTARMTLGLLHFLGMEAARVVSQIHHPGGFAYEIYYRCTGILPAAMLTILTMATSAPLRYKCLGLAAGIPLLIMLNLVRLVHLFHLGVHNSAAFGPAHGILWEAVIIVATLGIWQSWSRWVAGRNSRSEKDGRLDGGRA
jgi:exosortase/archaeosortase family protein